LQGTSFVSSHSATVTARQAQCFEVYERRAIGIAPHDKLLLLANRRESGFRATNGETVTVAGVDRQGRIQLEDGRLLPADYRQFDYGYAVTAHRSQGKSVDAVVISADAMKRELFYVAASRGRESVTVITSDKELLAESIGRSGERQSASELARQKRAEQVHEQRPGLHPGEHRGLDAARELALHSVSCCTQRNSHRRLPFLSVEPERSVSDDATSQPM